MSLSKSLKVGLGLAAFATVEAAHDTLIGADSPASVQILWFTLLILATIYLVLYILSLGVGTLRQGESGWTANLWLTIGVGIVTAIGLYALFIGFVIIFVIRNDAGHTPPGSDTESAINGTFISGLVYAIFYFLPLFLTGPLMRGSVAPWVYGLVTGLHWIALLIAFIFAIAVDTLAWVLLLIATIFLAVNGIILIASKSTWMPGSADSSRVSMPAAMAQHLSNVFGQVPMPAAVYPSPYPQYAGKTV